MNVPMWIAMDSRVDAGSAQDGTPCVFEWVDYFVDAPGAHELWVGGLPAKSMPDWPGRFRFRFENQLGHARVVALGQQGMSEATIFVLSQAKLPTWDSYEAFTRPLLESLYQSAVNLPFSFEAPTAVGGRLGGKNATPLFDYHFLKNNADAIDNWARFILGRPRRDLIDESILVPIWEMSSIDPGDVIDFVAGPTTMAASSLPVLNTTLPIVPLEVRQDAARDTLNTAENRFVVHFLAEICTVVRALADKVWWAKVSNARRGQLVALEAELRQALSDPLLDEIGEMTHLPTTSRVLMRADGYRQLYQLWLEFGRTSEPFLSGLQHAIDLRNVADLYEYWCFFELIERLNALSGCSPQIVVRTTDERGLMWNVAADFGIGRLVYNHGFRRWSLSYRPDYLWDAANYSVALDAKFRLNGNEVSKWASPELTQDTRASNLLEADSERHSQAKTEDITKMHAYRDALEVQAALVVYPGDAAVFYGTDKTKSGGSLESYLEEMLEGTLHGVGAAPLSPTEANGT